MAKVFLAYPIISISGAINKNDKYYFKTINGQTYLCRKPERKVINPVNYKKGG